MANREKNQFLRGLRHSLTPRLTRGASRAFGLLPIEQAQWLGEHIGNLAWYLAGARARRSLEHVRLALPDLPGHEQQRIARESFRAMGSVFAEACRLPSMSADSLRRRCSFSDEALVRDLLDRARGRGLVVFSAHLGSWEVALHAFSLLTGTRMMTVGARPSLESMAPLIKEMRESHGGILAWRGEAGLSVVKHLRKGGSLALLVDHNLKEEGVQVPFFGRAAHTALAPARLALQTGAVVTTIFPLRVGRGRFLLQVGPAIETPAASKDPQERRRQEIELTAAYTRRIEQAIRENPGQWMWMHRRWQERRKDSLPWPG